MAVKTNFLITREAIENELPRELRVLVSTAGPRVWAASDPVEIKTPEEITLTMSQVRAVVVAYNNALRDAEARVRARLAKSMVRRQGFFGR